MTTPAPTPTTFEQWTDELEKICQRRLGVSLLDLPDVGTFDAWDSGLTPTQAFNEFQEGWNE